ncbi:L-methionine transporter [Sistotremastrum niveocremeum HHB9708]|uniref:L-methionine transporter n=2 Tax=Sistotremastraceae TaxID=3402574 RepID=A0A165ALM1_9AGAM|nr:L-methionine transporter [Sistotremastrum niveocremeum HHB9708]KZT42052.1 amino acid transporter [Sistotremastrum suecicum HHB10207 ss-3]
MSTNVYEPLKSSNTTYPPSPPLSSSSRDSADSLRALELSEGPQSGGESYPTPRRTGRSYSISGFHFDNNLIPLSLSEPERSSDPLAPKNIGLIRGVALIAGLQIGSGIFSSPGVVVANAGSVGASLLVWLIGGLLAWTGASSFAELGCAIPLNGGAQAYLNHAYNPLIAYLFAWTAITALKPGGNAVIALIFGEYITRLFYHATGSVVAADELPGWSIKLTAVAAVLFVTVLCMIAPGSGTRAAVVFTGVKFAVTIIGIVQLIRGKASGSLRESIFEGTSKNPSSYALALYSALWALDGWDKFFCQIFRCHALISANYVGGEMKSPEKTLPRTIHCSMALVLTLFMTANTSYFVLLDKETVARSNTVALDFGRALMGPMGALIFAGMVAFSCFGALNGSFYTSARLISVAAQEGYLPSLFGRLHSTRKTPLNALMLQAGLTLMFILVGGGFRSLINFSVIALWGFYFLTVLGVVILRIKEPLLERPYKTFITTPLIFCAVALFLICMPVSAAPLEALAALGFILAGIPMYLVTQSRRVNDGDHRGVLGRVQGTSG